MSRGTVEEFWLPACPQKKSCIMKFRIDQTRQPIVDTFKFTYQFGVFQGLTKLLESEILKEEKDQHKRLKDLFSSEKLLALRQ